MPIKPPPKIETPPTVIPDHVQPSGDSPPEHEVLPPPSNEPTIIERQLNGCLVSFKDGAVVEAVETAFESRRVVVYGLTPYAISEAAILDALQGLPEVKQISMAPEHGEARLTFLTAAEAAQVVRSGAERLESFGEEVVVAFDTKSTGCASGSLRSTKVKVSWFGPSKIAWAHYPTVSRARQEAVRLDGYPFEGKKLAVQFQRPSRHQRSSFSIEIKGLPLSVKKAQIQALTGSDSVTLGQASYNLASSHTAVQQLLEKHGDIESFEVLSKDPSKSKVTAFAQFADPKAAEAAVKALHQQQQAFLRYSPLLIDHIHAIKYNIPARQFSVLKPKIDALRAKYDHPTIKLKHYERDESGQWLKLVCLRAYSSDPKLLAQVKAALEALFEGERVVSDAGVGIWDEYFAKEEGQQYLEALCSDMKVFIKLDLRLRRLSMFGEDTQRRRVREELIQKVISLQMERRAIRLSNQELRALVAGGMTSLQEELKLGKERLSLDITQRTLVIQGTNEDATAARELLKRLTAAAANQTSLGGSAAGGVPCPICFCDVSRPEKLPCGHTYCTDCLRHFLHSASLATVPSCLCIAPGCKQPIPYSSVIQRLLAPDDDARLLRTAFLAFVHARPDEFVYCPTPDCTTLYRAAPRAERNTVALRCPACLVRICAHCRVADHDGLRCSEYRYQCSGAADATAYWKQQHGIKPCPKCGADLEKDGGCNHITVSLSLCLPTLPTLSSPPLPRLASSRRRCRLPAVLLYTVLTLEFILSIRTPRLSPCDCTLYLSISLYLVVHSLPNAHVLGLHADIYDGCCRIRAYEPSPWRYRCIHPTRYLPSLVQFLLSLFGPAILMQCPCIRRDDTTR